MKSRNSTHVWFNDWRFSPIHFSPIHICITSLCVYFLYNTFFSSSYQSPHLLFLPQYFPSRASETFQDLAMQNAIGPGDEGNVRCSQLLSQKIRPFDPALWHDWQCQKRCKVIFCWDSSNTRIYIICNTTYMIHVHIFLVCLWPVYTFLIWYLWYNTWIVSYCVSLKVHFWACQLARSKTLIQPPSFWWFRR